MAVKRTKVLVYKGRNHPTTIDVSKNGEDHSFSASGVTKLGVVIGGTEYSSDDGYIEFVGTAVTFKLGSVPSPPRRKTIGRLIAYSAEFPNGYPVFTEKTDYQLEFEFL